MKYYILSLVLAVSQTAFAQFLIHGTVVDSQTGEAVNQANIQSGTKQVYTDRNGKFTISAQSGENTLTFNHIGYQAQQQIINVHKSEKNKEISVQLILYLSLN